MNKPTKISNFPKSVSLIACEWVAKLDRGDLSAEESQQLTKWLKQDPANHEAFATQLSEWTDMDVLHELARFEIVAENPSWIQLIRGFQFSMPRLAYLSSAFAIVLLAIFLVRTDITWGKFIPTTKEYAVVELEIITTVGELKTEALPDGSVIHVNTTSSADIAYSPEERAVTLHQGEAFFDVAPDKDRPFFVYTADTKIKAIGTAFAVHNEGGIIRVSVTEGSVEFIRDGVTTYLAAKGRSNYLSNSLVGNSAVYADEQTIIETQPADLLERKFTWQDGMLEFRGEPLEYVINQLGRYTDIQFKILDDDIKDLRLGGYFKIGDMQGLASTLALGFDIRVEQVSSQMIHVSRGADNGDIEK